MTTVPTEPPPGVEIKVWDVRKRDRIIRGGRPVTVTRRTVGVGGDLLLDWEGDERNDEGIAVHRGTTHIWSGENELVQLLDRPVNLPSEVAL